MRISLIRLLTCILCAITHIEINSSLQEPIRQVQKKEIKRMGLLNQITLLFTFVIDISLALFNLSEIAFIVETQALIFIIRIIYNVQVMLYSDKRHNTYKNYSFVIIFSSAFQAEYNMIPTRD